LSKENEKILLKKICNTYFYLDKNILKKSIDVIYNSENLDIKNIKHSYKELLNYQKKINKFKQYFIIKRNI